MRQPKTRVEVYAIKVTLLGTSPPVWRRILVPREITLRNLHRTLQSVMGWTNSHLHQFLLPRQRKDLQNFSKHSRTPLTRVTMRPVSGLAILFLNPSLRMTLTDDYAAGNTDAHKSPVDERYAWLQQ